MALLIQGDLSFAMGEQDKAANGYLEATKAETPWGRQKALAYNALGVSYALEGRQAEAKDYFDKALLADTGSFVAYSNLGYLFWQEGNWQEAQLSFEKVRNLQRNLYITFSRRYNLSSLARPFCGRGNKGNLYAIRSC